MTSGESVGSTERGEHLDEHRGVLSATSPASLLALCSVARFHQVAADPATLAHQLGIASTDTVTTDDLLRAAQYLGLKAKLSRSSIERLGLVPLPALAVMKTEDGSLRVVILAQSDGKRVLFQDLGKAASIGNVASAGPTIESAEVFASQWTGELILITSRAMVKQPRSGSLFRSRLQSRR